MENNNPLVEETKETSASNQPPSNGFSGVRMLDSPEDSRPDADLNPAEETKPAEEPTVDVEALKAELEAAKQKAAELEAKPPVKEVEYRLPEDYVSIMEDPNNRALLDMDPQNIPAIELYKQVVMREKPWITTQADFEKEVKKQFPEADFEIPENLGLDDTDWKEITFKADGERSSIASQQADLKGRLEAAKQSATQQSGPDENAAVEEMTKVITEVFNTGLAGLKPTQVDIPLEGFEFPSVSNEEVAEMFEKGDAIFKVDPEKGFVPDAQAMYDAILLKKTLEALKPMVEAAKRVAPIEARKALEASIANKELPNKDTGGVRSQDPNQKQVRVSPYSNVRQVTR
jgi:hypothetical protein